LIKDIATVSPWQQGQLVEITIADLSDRGDGVGRWGVEERVVFVPDTVPGDRILARLLWVKPRYAHGKLHQLLQPSPHRVQPPCIVADKCGGCQWQPVSYDYQLRAKRAGVIQALERIGKLPEPPVDPVLPAPAALGYRNKVTYPLGSTTDEAGTIKVQAGYFQKGSHRLINLNQCPVQDPRLNPLLAGIKQDIQHQGWPIYREATHEGQVRHLSLRIGRRTGEILLTLILRDPQLPSLAAQAEAWLQQYPGLVGVCLNHNPDRTNAIFGPETRCVAGRPYLWEEFADLRFQIRPDTFFQVYTEQAEALVQVILDHLNLQGWETVVDAYCGIGTLTLPMAQRVQQVLGLEMQGAAVEQARQNAIANQIENVRFQVGTVESLLPQLPAQPDILLLDPPRKGCAPAVIHSLIHHPPARLVYMSCNPATLARDLQALCQPGHYRLERVQPADFFPQTAHVECVAFLVR
jgi:23S rRNA (uracil1939-C5)-methyltransferase